MTQTRRNAVRRGSTGEPKRRGKRGRLGGRLLALALVAALVLQSALTGGGKTAEAAETQNGDSVYLAVGNPIWYGGLGAIGTAKMSVNDEVAYCADPANETPKAGYYTREAVKPFESGSSGWPISSIEKVLFYGYGGPGFDADFWKSHIGGTDADGRHFSPGLDWDDTPITGDEFYVYTHILLAERMAADESAALVRTSKRFKEWFCWNILGFTYGGDGGQENPNALGPAIEKLDDVPDGFEIFQLRTGNNSMWHEGAKSQTIVSFEYNPYVEVRFDKVSADASLTSGNTEYAYAGATYEIYEAAGDAKVATITTDEDGHATCKLKPNTSYYAVETSAPRGFVKSEKRVKFVTKSAGTTVKLSDQPGTLRLTVAKRDSATLGPAQAGATLEGAEYKIVDATGASHVATTDETGSLTLDGLPFGTVTVTETKAPEGYRIDAEVHKYHVSSKDMPETGVIELSPTGDFDEHVIAFDLDLVKYQDSGAEGSGLQEAAAGVEFEIVSNTTGEVVATLVTDEKGFATTQGGWFGAGERPDGVLGALPYDRAGYVVREVASTTPEGYQPAPDWHVTPEQMVNGATLHYIVDNDFVATRIQVVKTDAASGQSVPLAGFTFQLLDAEGNTLTQDVWYPNHEQISEFITDDSGSVTFPGELKPGTYRIREIAAEAPYLIAEEDLVVTIENSSEVTPISVVSFSDDQATGSATISKRCSTGAMEAGASVHDAGCTETLAGAEFDIVALQDVVSPDGTVRAVEGEVVAHVTTDESGTAVAEGLPLGTGSATYSFIETKPAPGHALDTTPHEFTLTYADDHTSVVTAAAEAVNEPTIVTIDKTILGTDKPLPGTVFALWREDPTGAEDGDQGEQILLTTDENGSIVLRHLPAGTYSLAEKSAPDGYVPDTTVRTFVVDEKGLIEGSSDLQITIENDFTKTLLSKRDITDESEVSGAHLSVLDADGNVVESWVSTEEPHLVEALPAGTYSLVEKMTPRTYDETTAVEFVVSSTGEVQTVVMYDEPVEVSGNVDKRQEVVEEETRDYDYTVDARSTSSTWVDEFTVTDDLTSVSAGLAELAGITTPVADGDYDSLLNVWYQTNLTAADHVDESGANATLSDGHVNPWLDSGENEERLGDDGRALTYEGWRLWRQDVSATEAADLSVSDLGLVAGEKVVAVRLEYGRVNPGFTTRTDGWNRDALKDVHDNVTDATAHEDDQIETGAERAPLIVHMRLTDAYRAGTRLDNQARVDLYRNGGGMEDLEDHDDDRVEQEREETPLAKTGDAILPVTGVATLGVVAVLLSMRRRKRR